MFVAIPDLPHNYLDLPTVDVLNKSPKSNMCPSFHLFAMSVHHQESFGGSVFFISPKISKNDCGVRQQSESAHSFLPTPYFFTLPNEVSESGTVEDDEIIE